MGASFSNLEVKMSVIVLQTSLWLSDGRLIILIEWSSDIGLDRYLLSTVPIWIRFPSVHLIFGLNPS